MSNMKLCPHCKAKIEKTVGMVYNCSYCHALLLQSNNRFSSIKCKGCSAPLKLEGELRESKILICGYCHTAMDSEHEFKALYTFSNIQKPHTRLEVGMRGTIEGVEFTIVSLIVYRSRGIEWLEFTLYSKKDTYAKLIKKEDKYLFFNKTLENIEQNIWLLKESDGFNLEHQAFTIENFYFTEIYYATGNISSKINQNQRSKQCFAKSKDSWFYSQYFLNDIIYYLGEELEKVEEKFIFT